MSITTAWQRISLEVTVKGFKKCYVSMQWMRLMMMCGGMSDKDEDVEASVRKMKALTVV